MRPLRLQIEGLTAFRAKQEVDFRELDLFVVIGPTGAGKSTILDALVFALYGAIPRMTTGPSALVTHGATMAKVMLEFAADGETYQVARRLPKKGAQRATLHCRVGEDWLPAVDDDGVRAVNARIEKIVGLDFDGFTRAVLLPQGKFAEFLRGKPEQRREILVRLLDLSRYERVAERARQEANRIDSEISATLRLIEQQFADATEDAVIAAESAMQAAQAHRDVLYAAEEKARESLSDLTRIAARRGIVAADIRVIDDAADELRKADARWRELAPRQATLDEAYRTAAAALESADSAHGDAQRHLADVLAETGGEETLAGLKAAHAGLDVARLGLTRAGDNINAARQERDDLERKVAAAAEARAGAEAADTAARAADAEIRRREQGAVERLRRAEASATLAARVASRRGELDGCRARLVTQDEAVREAAAALEVADERARQARIGHEAAHLRAGLTVGQPCPVCLQDVTAVPEVIDISPLATALKAAQTAHRLAEQAAAGTRAELQVAERILAEDEMSLAGFADAPSVDAARADHEELVTELEAVTAARSTTEAALRSAVEDYGRLAASLAGARERLAGQEAAAAEAQDRIAAAEQTLSHAFPNGIPSDAGAVIEARRAACREARTGEESCRKDADTARRSLAAADKARRTLADDSSRLMQECAGQRAILATLARRVDAESLDNPGEGIAIADEIASLLRWTAGAGQALAARVQALDEERVAGEGQFDATLAAAGVPARPEAPDRGLGALRNAAQGAADSAVRAETQRDAVRQKLADRHRMEEGIVADRARQQLHAALATELRRDRFLDFLLSESVDRLAAIASEELRRISNDRYSLQSEETSFVVIDHANADETRSVETLSGGETFLASLSLATALARSITDIAGEAVGSRLEAMFIDEGFGTLDDESLDAVIDALERLREADRLVGVITHVAQLAERIPDGLQVERRGGGSVISRRDAAGRLSQLGQ